MQPDNPVCHLAKRIIVSDHDDCVAIFLIYSLDECEDVLGRVVIQSSCRFIAQKNVRILDNGSSNRAALLLSTGELVRELSSVFKEPQRVKQLVDFERLVAEVCPNFYVLI